MAYGLHVLIGSQQHCWFDDKVAANIGSATLAEYLIKGKPGGRHEIVGGFKH